VLLFGRVPPSPWSACTKSAHCGIGANAMQVVPARHGSQTKQATQTLIEASRGFVPLRDDIASGSQTRFREWPHVALFPQQNRGTSTTKSRTVLTVWSLSPGSEYRPQGQTLGTVPIEAAALVPADIRALQPSPGSSLTHDSSTKPHAMCPFSPTRQKRFGQQKRWRLELPDKNATSTAHVIDGPMGPTRPVRKSAAPACVVSLCLLASSCSCGIAPCVQC